jgi:hypothetical protein
MLEGLVQTATGANVDEFSIEIEDEATKFSRSEDFFAANGGFAIHDLPAGKFTVTATAGSATGGSVAALAEGESKSGLVLKLGGVVTVTGAIVDERTKAPVAGLRVGINPVNGGNDNGWSDDNPKRVTDAAGKFSVNNVAVGNVAMWAYSGVPDFGWNGVNIKSNIPDNASGSVDIGTFGVIARRTKDKEPVGQTGVSFKERGDWKEPAILMVARVDPIGPAAKLDIKAGDLIVAADGIDVTGNRSYLYSGVVTAPPGTKIELTLQRGNKVVVTLAAPK